MAENIQKEEKIEPQEKEENDKSAFINLFSSFYEKFFNSSAEAIEILADFQRDYNKEYNSIRNFNQDPDSISELIEGLSPEEQAILLKILLNAGNFGKKISNLFDSTEKDKRKLADDLKIFAKDLVKEIKKEKVEKKDEPT